LSDSVAETFAATLPSPVRLDPLAFADLRGWRTDAHAAALATFRRSCERMLNAPPPSGATARAAETLLAAARAAVDARPARARRFFEQAFRPYLVRVPDGAGLLTGYYEPEIEGRREAGGGFSVPLLGRPDDLVMFTEAEPAPQGFPAGYVAARRKPDGTLEPYLDRGAIEDGALAGRGLELVFLRDPADAFFAQIQGSLRVRLGDGSVLRLAYAGRNGHPYTSIGRVLLQEGLLPREALTMQSIRAWIAADAARGRALMRKNSSYVFFRIDDTLLPGEGPRGAEGVPLSTGRSLAVDRTIWPYGVPFWLEGALPNPAGGRYIELRRLVVAQDTGSAILGAARGDLFCGSGPAAGALAGGIKEPVRFVALLPRADGR
jgi:membrane-bound lytic murein transglycosylase A